MVASLIAIELEENNGKGKKSTKMESKYCNDE